MREGYKIRRVNCNGQLVLGKYWASMYVKLEKQKDGSLRVTVPSMEEKAQDSNKS